MLRHFRPRVFTIVIALAVVASGVTSGVSWSAALVGPTSRIPPAPVPEAGLEQLKMQYRRPETIPFPSGDPYTPQKAMLGRMLYYDTRMSGAGTLACASCHNPAFGHGGGIAQGIGDGLPTNGRQSLSVINSAWGQLFMWDGRANSLEDQVPGPIQSTMEMNQPLDHLTDKLAEIPGYKSLFAAAFPHSGLTLRTVADAVATYERTIVSAPAPFDAWIEGDEAAIPAEARRGFVLFNGKARCASCHGGWRFTDDGFHDIGLPDDDDKGRGRLLPQINKMQHAFKTPGLRETALSAPYMHNGSLPTLEAVVDHYNRGGVNRRSQSELVTPLGLSVDEEADIVAFLRSLTGPITSNVIPALPH
jgi:cytochrome c peroxidase